MRYFYVFLFFLMFYEFVVYMSNDMYTPAFPFIAEYFSVHSEAMQLTLSAWLVGGAAAQLILGPLSDSVGRRPVLFGGGAVFLLSCIVCATTTSIYCFILSRFFQGVGVCSMMIAGYACIHATYHDRDAVSILAMMSSVSATAPMIGPLLGGYLIAVCPWQSIFWSIGGLACIAVACLYFFMPQDRPDQKVPLNFKGVLSSYYALIKNGKFICGALTLGLLYSGLILWISTSPFILMVENNLDSKQFGLAQVPIFASFVIGAQLVRFLIDRISVEKYIMLGIYGALVSSGVLLLNVTVPGIILGMMLYALSFGLIAAPLNRKCFNVSQSPKGVTASVFYTCTMTIAAVSTIIFGFVYTGHVISYALAMVVVVGVAVLLFRKTESK